MYTWRDTGKSTSRVPFESFQKVCTRNVTSLGRPFSRNTYIKEIDVQDAGFLATLTSSICLFFFLNLYFFMMTSRKNITLFFDMTNMWHVRCLVSLVGRSGGSTSDRRWVVTSSFMTPPSLCGNPVVTQLSLCRHPFVTPSSLRRHLVVTRWSMGSLSVLSYPVVMMMKLLFFNNV